MKLKLSIKDFANHDSVQTIGAEKLKDLKGGGGPNVNPPGMMNFPGQAKGCPPPLDDFS